MRLYTFSNGYLSSLQVGIQSAHTLTEMFLKYEPNTNEHTILWTWADEYKTMILLNGGYAQTIANLALIFDDIQNQYPWAVFHEEQATLAGALTCAGIILPQKVYEMARILRQTGKDQPIYEEFTNGHVVLSHDNDYGIDLGKAHQLDWEFNCWEFIMVQNLNTFSLAH